MIPQNEAIPMEELAYIRGWAPNELCCLQGVWHTAAARDGVLKRGAGDENIVIID